MLPTIEEYKDSFREPSEYFKTLSLEGVPSKFDANEPYFISGGFACVFKVKQNNEFWAFKCFLQEDKHRNERLTILSKFLQERTESYFIKTHFYTDELWVCSQLAGDAEYPTFAMPWIEGQTLGEYIHQAAKERKTEKIKVIYDEFLRLAHFLLTNEFAHGDLKHDNILVTQDQNLILIDYDGMYLPQLAHISSQELGGHAYQHPKRTAQDWGKHIDDFSILVILLSLRAFIVLPSLIDDHHTENLLLTDNDIKNPMQSPLLQTLWQQEDEQLKQLFGMLINSLAQNNLRVLEIGAFVERNKVDRNFFDMECWSGLDEKWKSILRWHTGKKRYTKRYKSEIDFFDKIYNLEILDLNRENTGELPNWIGKLTNLTELYLGTNQLTELPSSIGNLTNLTELNLWNNYLTELPKSIGNLIELNKIYLSSNEISKLPESIGKLTKLEYLSLSDNMLRELPNNIGNLTKLKTLYLIGNPISNQEKERIKKALPNCQIFFDNDVSFNNTNRVEEFSFNMKWWNSIDTQWKSIFREAVKGNEYSTDFFTKITNLTQLNLAQKHIAELPDWIGNLTNLTKIDLTCRV